MTTPNYYGVAPTYATPPQPQYSQVPPPPQSVERQTVFMFLDNPDGANTYPLAPNHTAYLMTKDEKVLIKKSTDEYGRVIAMDKFDLSKEVQTPTPVETPQIDTSNFATKDQLQGFAKQKDYDELLEMIGSMQDEIAFLKGNKDEQTESKRGRKAG